MNASQRERAEGEAAAERLANEWPDVGWIPEDPTAEWAKGALVRFRSLISEQPPLFRASRRGAGRGASSLSPRPYQGVVEVLQNADDLDASELRIAVRNRGGRRELLFVHDGHRVQLHHVGAMLLPWLTTKSDDPFLSGRFGIGQQTLRFLGGPLEVHCSPFHFVVEDDGPAVARRASPIEGLYEDHGSNTLFVLPLLKRVDLDELTEFVRGLGPESLLFLQSIRMITLWDLGQQRRPTVEHKLRASSKRRVDLTINGEATSAERVELRAGAARFVRYMVSKPIGDGEAKRDGKATGSTTPLGIAVPARENVGHLYDRLPMPIAPGFPFSLNAQFDPDAPRTSLLRTEWNQERISDLGALTASIAIELFQTDPAVAWSAFPLRRDLDEGLDGWLGRQLTEDVIEAAQERILTEVRLQTARGLVRLHELVYEAPELQGLLTQEDMEKLRPGTALTDAQRDPAGRWRSVLDELGVSDQISPEEAIRLFDRDDAALESRAATWFVHFADVAFAADLLDDFLSKRSILLADGRRIESPGAQDPWCLVDDVEDGSLAATLEMGLPIHPAYLRKDEPASRVSGTLKENGILLDDISSASVVLRILARDHDNNTLGRIRLTDEKLIALRDAFEALSEDDQRDLGTVIGRNVELKARRYGEGRTNPVEVWASPAEAYLPAAIDRETSSFAKAAAGTPGIVWLDPAYARTLKREGGRAELGAQRFLVRLGAATAPRLTRPGNERPHYRRDPRPASGVYEIRRPDIQLREIRSLSLPAHRCLLDDRWCPDLDRVIADIAADRAGKRRRQRGLALLGMLARSWERQYADYEKARAVYGSGGYWHDPRPVIATWLARAASEPWLPSAAGSLMAPAELCLPTPASRLAYGNDRNRFLAKVEDNVLRSGAVSSLRLQQGPAASALVNRLRELRGAGTPNEGTAAEAKTIYRLLALYAPADQRRPVGDMSVKSLKEAFSEGPGREGLLLADGQWIRPSAALRGHRIFGRHRPFVTPAPDFERLWTLLEIPEPTAADCAQVLRELSAAPLEPADRATVLETMRALAGMLDDTSTQFQVALRRLPLWTEDGWRSERPIYAIEDDELAAGAACTVPVWRSGFTTFHGLEVLLQALEVTVLHRDDFRPVRIDPAGVVRGDHLRSRFGRAVEHLRDELAKGDQPLHDSLRLDSWRPLATALIMVQNDLQLTADLADGGRLTVPARAHVMPDPLALVVSDELLVGDADAAGRALGSLFEGDRQKIAWAWASMWQRAGTSQAPDDVILSTSRKDDGQDDLARLLQLQAQAKARNDGNRRGARRQQQKKKKAPAVQVTVQPLKDLDAYEPDEGQVVNVGRTSPGVVFPTRDRAGAAARRRSAKPEKRGTTPDRTSSRTVPASLVPPTPTIASHTSTGSL